MGRRTLVIALDGFPFEVYARIRDELSNISGIADNGSWGVLRAIDPPITVPAWASMLTGRDPGELGIYGFRHLKRGSYSGYIVSSVNLKARYMWESMGLRSIVIGLPPGYPPRRYDRGVWISDFYTPDTNRVWTYPPELGRSIGRYIFDVEYRTEEKDRAFRELIEMTRLRWRVARRLMEEYRWDVFVIHEIGVDRAHHLFQKYYDPEHPRYEPGNRYEDYIPEYYRVLDREIGDLVGKAREVSGGELSIYVLSDHGNQAQRGVYAINEWLIENGYLELEEEPRRGVDIEEARIRWGRTKVWAWGGYYARVFINRRGREPQGIVDGEEYLDLLRELKRKMKTIKAPWGYSHNQVYEPSELYRAVRGDPPDLIVYMDNLRTRPVQSIGYENPWLEENDRGPDDSLHSFNGVFISDSYAGFRKKDLHALDVSKTIFQQDQK